MSHLNMIKAKEVMCYAWFIIQQWLEEPLVIYSPVWGDN